MEEVFEDELEAMHVPIGAFGDMVVRWADQFVPLIHRKHHSLLPPMASVPLRDLAKCLVFLPRGLVRRMKRRVGHEEHALDSNVLRVLQEKLQRNIPRLLRNFKCVPLFFILEPMAILQYQKFRLHNSDCLMSPGVDVRSPPAFLLLTFDLLDLTLLCHDGCPLTIRYARNVVLDADLSTHCTVADDKLWKLRSLETSRVYQSLPTSAALETLIGSHTDG
mmetsp:Transcript_10295/g.20596  ORF Transcript_10295/g.20596 Transcript_10295/m.20596 type:complete len:220 (-) Transcript_10295:486-1145(-)